MAKETTKDKVALVRERYETARAARMPQEQQWHINLAFLEGRQYVFWNSATSSLEQIRPVPHRVRHVSNIILPHWCRETARLGRNDPIFNVIPNQLLIFIVLVLFAYLLLHKTTYGRKLYAIGNSATASKFSGIPVRRIRMINFALTGLFAGIAAILLTSRIGSTRPNIALGYELEAITLVVLGGVSITGGKGNIFGVILAVFLLGYLKFGMALLNMSAKIMIITTGALLIVAVLIPEFISIRKKKNKLKKQKKDENTEEVA